ncbi:MAG: hypothetical protein ACLGIZ_13070 [Acidimicrobiia bacterium]
MRKAIIAAIVATALFAVGAFAANISVTADDVASGEAPVGACGTAEVISYDTNAAVVPAGDTADFRVEAATVRLTGAECSGADVDLAIGSDSSTDSDGNYDTADVWKDAECGPGAAVNGSSGTQFDYVCDFVEGTGPLVRPIVEVAVLANGNSLPTGP